ncbi:hypothetical protein HK101_003479 [Irineochytrium annulatum]|nr:hypothetical protein HK101_003479 [Irineochytrium annulatum]
MQGLGVLRLDRPDALNALNLSMIRAMTPKIKYWASSDITRTVLMTGAEGSRAFCAGGDVKAVLESLEGGRAEEALGFTGEEYRLMHLIGTCKKPVVSILDGITMGAGVGLAVHAPFRVVTENTVFAMPETAIGLFPDVGGSFFLPRLDGELGTFLGLTGGQLRGLEVMYAGIGTHFVPSERLPALTERLTHLDTEDMEVVNAALEDFVGDTTLEEWMTWRLGGDTANAIDRCFKYNSLEEIVEALQREKSEWAGQTLASMRLMSPLSLKIALQQLRHGRHMGFAQCFRMEYDVVRNMLATKQTRDNVLTGIRSVLVDRRRPAWSPSWDHMRAVTKQHITDLFKAHEPLELMTDATFHQYPHKTLSGWPTGRDVENVINGYGRRGVTGKRMSAGEALHFITTHWGAYDRRLAGEIGKSEILPRDISIENGFSRGKVGLREKVESYLARRGTRGR